MQIEYDFKAAGLVEAGKLKPGDCYINGGIVNEPNVFLVTSSPMRQWNPKTPDDDTMYVKTFNYSKSAAGRIAADKFVCKVKGKIVITGTDYCIYAQTCGLSGAQDYTVKWHIESQQRIAEVKATNDITAVQAVLSMKHEPHRGVMHFTVVRPDGNKVMVDVSTNPFSVTEINDE